MSDLGAEVEAFSAQLTDAIAHSEGAKSQAGLSSHELEAARVALCNALYAVLGGLVKRYPDNPDRVAGYFDIATMHRHRHRRMAKAEAALAEG